MRRGLALTVGLVTAMVLLQVLPEERRQGPTCAGQVCDLAWMVAVVALRSRGPRLATLLHLWGLILVTQAFTAPDRVLPFPDVRRVMPWWTRSRCGPRSCSPSAWARPRIGHEARGDGTMATL